MKCLPNPFRSLKLLLYAQSMLSVKEELYLVNTSKTIQYKLPQIMHVFLYHKTLDKLH